MTAEEGQEELSIDRYMRLIEEYQKLQQAHAIQWAANERMKYLIDEYETAIIVLLKRVGHTQLVLSPSEVLAAKSFKLIREQRASLIFKVVP